MFSPSSCFNSIRLHFIYNSWPWHCSFDSYTHTQTHTSLYSEPKYDVLFFVLLLTNQVWEGRWRVIPHDVLPDWLKDNDFLLHGHRPPMPSFRACFRSIFRIHTETGNIWTHLLGDTHTYTPTDAVTAQMSMQIKQIITAKTEYLNIYKYNYRIKESRL